MRISHLKELITGWQLRIHELNRAIEIKEEERRIADEVVSQYAVLVRKMEGRKPALSEKQAMPSTDNSEDLKTYYQTGKLGIQRLLSDHEKATCSLHHRIDELERERAEEAVRVSAFITAADNDRKLLASAQDEIVRMQRDDNAAAKVVSRYMAFSQANNTALQKTLTALRKQHTATVHTLNSQVSLYEAASSSAERLCAKFSDALGELSEDLAREAYGRRREVSLRLALLVREAGLAEGLARWARGAKELYNRLQDGQHDDALDTKTALSNIVEGTTKLLGTLNGDTNVHKKSLKDLLDSGEDGSGPGALGRVIVAQEAVRAVVEDLREETERRIRTDKERVKLLQQVEALRLDLDQVSHESSGLHGFVDTISTSSASKINVISSPGVIHQPQPISSQIAHFSEASETSSSDKTLASESSSGPIGLQEQVSSTTATSPDLAPGTLSSRSKDTVGRYDHLQKYFQDCHVALKALTQPNNMIPPPAIIQGAIRRLEDFTEDARVELEIRVADEERRIRGYEMMLSIPLAIDSDEERQDIERRLDALCSGTDSGVTKTMEHFGKKLEDVEHDIACLKRAIHEQQEESSQPLSNDADRSQSPSTPWSAWATSLIRSPTRSTSPIPPQSFGAVITSPRGSTPRPTGRERDVRYAGLDSPRPDPLASLGMRISMPSQVYPASPSSAVARKRAGSISSGFYALGLNIRASSYSMQQVMSSPRMADHAELVEFYKSTVSEKGAVEVE